MANWPDRLKAARHSPAMLHPIRVHRVVLAAAFLLYVVFALRTGFAVGGETYYALADDASISMRYARHLAEGHGIVWNIGDPPLEGYTNFSWMLVMAGVHLLPFATSKMALPVMLLGVLTLCGVLLMMRALMREVEADGLATIIAGASLAFFFPLAFWTLRGLEVGQASLVAMACAWLAFRLESGATWPRLLGFAMLATLGMTIRIDFAAQLAIVLAYLGWQARRQGWLPRFGLLLVAVAIGVGVYAAFKIAYFGDFFPNTYYLKLTGISLLTRVKVGVSTFVDVTLEDLALPVAVVLLGLLTNRGMTTPRTALFSALFLVQCAYSVYSGGDYNEYDVRGANRFVTQGMPFLFVLTGLHASALIARGRNWTLGEGNGPAAVVPGLVMAAAIVVACSGDEWFRWGLGNAPEMRKERDRVRTGLLIKASSAPSAVVAAAAAGQIPYFAERRALDVLGKADAVIAKGPSRGEFRPGHNKWNLEHTVRDLQPDVVVMGRLEGSDELPGWGYEKVSDEMWIRTSSKSIDKERLRGALP